ncbi:SPT2-domain-containing protein [Metschnikowia bicuspidata var. bicuspidata NRRL YB-4993]|uniref:SPT2-domain-containing protein n=1 Tax=Metschnikowia bicuspidata var. bicuspidata NRRL YB-4993 TaxID=869754 RepID=A0A1A0HD30_9ASCO|nr:SPT2-domain-containing protein [Metschnikowia bicuspidata var. bicuspidata NRRL YB-4993]OBA21848.1 SPT2-domain-containing protein [Metschnikowia bicuspidata var. bicuspidata NRRL YB-4993]
MSASKILEQILRKGKITPVALANNSAGHTNDQQSTKPPRPNERPVDPVVARLKAARKAEREQKERELREKKGLPAKKATSTKPRIGPRQPARSLAQRTTPNNKSRTLHTTSNRLASAPPLQAQNTQNEKKPKMSFSQLMAKASGIDQSKMSIALKQKAKSSEVAGAPKRRTPEHDSRPDPASRKLQGLAGSLRNLSQESGRIPSLSARARSGNLAKAAGAPRAPHETQNSSQTRAPHPTRKPSSALAEKLKQKPRGKSQMLGHRAEVHDDESDESDMDSFIASEDEEMEQDEPEYDRDEIWSILNRGKKRSHYSYDDYDSDDMEATGAEILEEESQSKRNALLEDKREMEKEAKLAALKRARKSGIRR